MFVNKYIHILTEYPTIIELENNPERWAIVRAITNEQIREHTDPGPLTGVQNIYKRYIFVRPVAVMDINNKNNHLWIAAAHY